jgi:hypothetical protein
VDSGDSPRDDAQAFLPSLERLRSEASGASKGDDETPPPSAAMDLLARGPTEQGRYSAIVLAADFLRRERWTQDVDISTDLYERYPRQPPGTPEAFRNVGYQYLEGDVAAQPQRCRSCFLTRGKIMCNRCGGTGQGFGGPCTCEYGYMKCTTCDGSGESVRARIVHLNDTHASTRSVFTSRELAPFQGGIEQLVKLDEPPSGLRVPLEARVAVSAYRGATAARDAEFHGYAYGSALEAALDAVDKLRREDVVKEDLRAYAWPVLLVRIDVDAGPLVVGLVVDPGGRSRVLLG